MKDSRILFCIGVVFFVAGILIGNSNTIASICALGWSIVIFIVGEFTRRNENEVKLLITEEELDKLQSFGREVDGSYCDRWEFSIIPILDKNKKIIKWSFCLFEEVHGKNTRVRYITTMSQLKILYEVITDKKLV